MSARRNHEIMRLYLEEVLPNGDLSILDDIAAVDMVDHVAEAAGWRKGRDGWVDHVNYFRAAFPDVRVIVHRIVSSDDDVVGVWTATGSHSADFLGVDATGRQVTGTAASIFAIRDGMVVDYLVITDRYGPLQQMGALPSP